MIIIKKAIVITVIKGSVKSEDACLIYAHSNTKHRLSRLDARIRTLLRSMYDKRIYSAGVGTAQAAKPLY